MTCRGRWPEAVQGRGFGLEYSVAEGEGAVPHGFWNFPIIKVLLKMFQAAMCELCVSTELALQR